MSVENRRAGAEPEVCVCGSCVQHPREHAGQQRRSKNIANSSIYANTTGLNMGAHGTGTPRSHEEHKMLQLESFFCFNKPFSVLSVVNIMLMLMMLMTEAFCPFVLHRWPTKSNNLIWQREPAGRYGAILPSLTMDPKGIKTDLPPPQGEEGSAL